MSEVIGSKIPPPLRFEFGAPPTAGQPAQVVTLSTVDDDGNPRLAVLAKAEIRALDETRLRLELRRDSHTRANLAARPQAALWCVLDGAAYTIRGSCCPAREPAADSDREAVELSVTSVLRDFEPSAPLVAGPTCRAIEH